MSPALATIVVPLLRQQDAWLDKSLASAAAQTAPTELLVITAPCTPASNLAILDRVQAPAHVRVRVAPQTGHGFANALNTGIHLATTDRVGFLLSDDWLDPDAILESASVDADLVSTGMIRIDERDAELPHLRRMVHAEGLAKRTTDEQRAAYLTHFLLFRRATLIDAGGLDETLGDAPGIDDYDLVWTLLERGARVGFTDRPLYHCRVHAGERLTMRDRDAQTATLERIFDKHAFHGAARAQRLAEHARWFGRPEDEVWRELRAD